MTERIKDLEENQRMGYKLEQYIKDMEISIKKA
jgi:hypothetical protein